MIKKALNTIFIFTILMFSLLINTNEAVNLTASLYQTNAYDDFDDSFYRMKTQIRVTIFKEDENIATANKLFTEIESIFEEYELLTNNFEAYIEINNVYYINQNPEQRIEIRKELYDIIKMAEEIKIETNGYFDISIGKVVDRWKQLISEYKYSDQDVSKVEFDDLIADINQIQIISDGIKLEEETDKYFITIKNGVKIDLGAIAKGYAVLKAKEHLEKSGVIYYRIKGSLSSLKYGIEPNKDTFSVGVTNQDGEVSGIVTVKNTSVTTSGDSEQNFKYKNRIYSHIVSPKTKMSENYVRKITIIHDNPAYADALTTALFSMDSKTREAWIKEHSDIQYIAFNEKGVIENNIDPQIFTAYEEEDTLKTTIKDWLIISAVIIIAFLGFYMISRAFSKLKYDKAAIIHDRNIIATINFAKGTIDINQEYKKEYEGKTYPIIDYDNKTITVIGSYTFSGKLQEMVILFDFDKHSIQVISETSPEQVITKMGESTGKTLISEPYNIIIKFGDGEIETDDQI